MLILMQIMAIVKPERITVPQRSCVPPGYCWTMLQRLRLVMMGQWIERQVVDAKRRAELVEEELAKRKSSREDMRAQLEREAEAGLKLQLQQKDFEWRQKYQVMLHILNRSLIIHWINRTTSHGMEVFQTCSGL